jgi:hypothetical protein
LCTDDLVEIQQLLARYAVTITQGDIDGVLATFTPDGSYSAFGDTYPLAEFPALVAAAPKGLFLTGTPAIELAGDTATGPLRPTHPHRAGPRRHHRLLRGHGHPGHQRPAAAHDARRRRVRRGVLRRRGRPR